MLLSVLLISSAVLGATTIASLLVLFQLRQAADAKTSAQAVFAADAGVERALFQRGDCVVNSDYTILSGDSEFSINSNPYYGNPKVKYGVIFSEDCQIVRSAGLSNRSSRAFQINLAGLINFEQQFTP